MTKKTTVLAFDLGASSGRAIRAEYDGESFRWEELHRFENNPVEKDGHLRWDFESLLREIRAGIQKAGAFDSVAFDTWGVDFGLLGEDGKLLSDPVHYRDGRTDHILDSALRTMDGEALYGETGTQLLPINTLFQLLALREQEPDTLARAKTLLLMPDLFRYCLCGGVSTERSADSTAQLLRLPQGEWSEKILTAFGLPESLLPPLVPGGSAVGRLPENGALVLATAGHDTQCAVAALPDPGPDAAFLSCGTWSLLGCELDAPILTPESMRLGLSNEWGANGKINYLKNIIGLWLIQESRRAWKRAGESYSYADLERLALAAEPLRCFIDPDDPVFTPPGDLPGRVQEYCRKTGQFVPQTVGEIMRCIYESLALKYRWAISQLQQATGRRFGTLHVLGGGAKDGLLCRMTADAAGLRVVAGPVEATALGNLMLQLTALGAIPSLEEGRRWIARGEKLTEYLPQTSEAWETAYQKYQALLESV